MKKLFENFRNFINEVEKLVCPPATQDVKTYDVIEKDGWVYVTL